MLLAYIGSLVLVSYVVCKGARWLRVLTIVLFFLFIHYASRWSSETQVHRYYHSAMNVGIGHPYQKLVHHLHSLSLNKQYNILSQRIVMIEEESEELFEVWLTTNNLAYKIFVDEMLASGQGAIDEASKGATSQETPK